MKISQLMMLAEAAQVALPHLKPELQQDTEAAIEAAFLEARKRLRSRELGRANRPSRTVRREAIRQQLSLNYHNVRLARNGQWHVQTAAGTAWMLFALSDSAAEDLLDRVIGLPDTKTSAKPFDNNQSSSCRAFWLMSPNRLHLTKSSLKAL